MRQTGPKVHSVACWTVQENEPHGKQHSVIHCAVKQSDKSFARLKLGHFKVAFDIRTSGSLELTLVCDDVCMMVDGVKAAPL
jgi:hypothetical protein